MNRYLDILRTHLWPLSTYFLRGFVLAVLMVMPMLYYWQTKVTDSENIMLTAVLYLPLVSLPVLTVWMRASRKPYLWLFCTELALSVLFLSIARVMPTSPSVPFVYLPFFLAGMMFAIHEAILMNTEHDNNRDGLMPDGNSLVAFSLALLLGMGILPMIVGNLQVLHRNQIPLSWSQVFYGISLLIFLFSLCNILLHPRGKVHNTDNARALTSMVETARTFSQRTSAQRVSFVRGRYGGMIVCLLFLFLYIMPEAMLSKPEALFLIDGNHKGGLGFSPQEFGLIQGTVGVFGILLGGILGGLAVKRYGLKRCLWPMTMLLTVPNLLLVYLAYVIPQSLTLVNICLFVERTGFGFGLIGYLLYITDMYKGEHNCNMQSFLIAIVALAIVLPCLLSGPLCSAFGYAGFFVFDCFLCIFTFLATALVKHNLLKNI